MEMDSANYTKNAVGIQTFTGEDIDGSEMESKFSDLRPDMQKRLQSKGIEELFAVQKYTYKMFIEGFELIVKSKTGSGKTLAFLLPMEELIKRDSESEPANNNIKAVILEPTRELAI